MLKFKKGDEVTDLTPCHRTAVAYAKKMDEEFEVTTPLGTLTGAAGDYLMLDPTGEFYVATEAAFMASYRFMNGGGMRVDTLHQFQDQGRVEGEKRNEERKREARDAAEARKLKLG